MGKIKDFVILGEVYHSFWCPLCNEFHYLSDDNDIYDRSEERLSVAMCTCRTDWYGNYICHLHIREGKLIYSTCHGLKTHEVKVMEMVDADEKFEELYGDNKPVIIKSLSMIRQNVNKFLKWFDKLMWS